MVFSKIFPNYLVQNLKETYIDKSNEILCRSLIYNSVCNKFPDFKVIFDANFDKSNFREILYCLLRDIQEIPKCPICGSPLKIRNYQKGFQQTCSRKCANILMANDQNHREQHSEKLKQFYVNNHKENVFDKLNISNYEKISNSTYLIHNYCKHGDLKINSVTASLLYERKSPTLCLECAKEIYNNYIPTENEILDFQNNFSAFFSKNKHNVKFSWFLRYYPKELKIIISYFEKHFGKFTDNINFAEVMYIFLNKLVERPICPICGNVVKFSRGKYMMFCEEHSKTYSISGIELEIQEYVKSLGIDYKFNNHSIIGKELDIYIEKYKLAIEINGCWWHSSAYKDKNYHYDKSKRCKNKGIFLLHIWEDDWLNRIDIVKYEIIKNLELVELKEIDIGKCIIKNLSHLEASHFYKDNSLIKYVRCKQNKGLFINDDLISVISITKNTVVNYCCKEGYFLNIESLKEIGVEYAMVDIEHDKLYLDANGKYKEKVLYCQRKNRIIRYYNKCGKCWLAGHIKIKL